MDSFGIIRLRWKISIPTESRGLVNKRASSIALEWMLHVRHYADELHCRSSFCTRGRRMMVNLGLISSKWIIILLLFSFFFCPLGQILYITTLWNWSKKRRVFLQSFLSVFHFTVRTIKKRLLDNALAIFLLPTIERFPHVRPCLCNY